MTRIRISKVYTRQGDGGETRLGGGEKCYKDSPRVEAYGSVDELNAALGAAHSACSQQAQSSMQDLLPLLARIQNHLFDLGSDLCRPESPDKKNRFPSERALWLEGEIDRFNASLSPLENFILPAGAPSATALHCARTIARRAERRFVALARNEPDVSAAIGVYLNRLSDLLFVLARFCNQGEDTLWRPNTP